MDNRDDKLKVAQAAHQKLARAAYELSLTPNGKLVLDSMRTLFSDATTLRMLPDKSLDVNASIAAAGGREVVIWFDSLVQAGSNAPFKTVQGNKEVSNG